MTVAGRVPSRNAFICATICSFGRPASGTPSVVTLRPSVPWQAAQVAARLRATALSWACAAAAASASAAATSLAVIGSSARRRVLPGAEKAKAALGRPLAAWAGPASGDRRSFLFERELEALVLTDIDGHLAAMLQPAEEQLVGERAADRVLDEPRHRPRAHQRVEAFLREVRLQRRREARLDLLLGKLLVELHQELLHHAHDRVLVERGKRDDRVEPVAELGREHLLDRLHLVPRLHRGSETHLRLGERLGAG